MVSAFADDGAARPAKRRRREPSADLYDEVLEGAAAALDDAAEGGAANETAVLKPMTREELERYNAKADRTGMVYLSRIPPGMGPSQVRHQLGKFGDIGRVFLQRDERDAARPGKKKKRAKHQSHRFAEGWVEFLDKKVARSLADMLNAQTIGGPKSSPFHDDIWTMKYLPKFKWNMLSEQVALEASTTQALLRSHLAQSKRDQAAYLGQVERARVDGKRAEKRAAREERARERGDAPPTAAAAAQVKAPRKERSFSQRTGVAGPGAGNQAGGATGSSKELDAVLANLF